MSHLTANTAHRYLGDPLTLTVTLTAANHTAADVTAAEWRMDGLTTVTLPSMTVSDDGADIEVTVPVGDTSGLARGYHSWQLLTDVGDGLTVAAVGTLQLSERIAV